MLPDSNKYTSRHFFRHLPRHLSQPPSDYNQSSHSQSSNGNTSESSTKDLKDFNNSNKPETNISYSRQVNNTYVNNSYINNTYVNNSYKRIDDLVPNQFAVLPEDRLLISSLRSIDQVKTNEFSSRDPMVSIIQASKEVSKKLLSTLKTYPARFLGKANPRMKRSAEMVANFLGDIYDPVERRLFRREYLDYDYFGLITQEEQNGRTLIAIDQGYVIPAIIQYFEEHGYYEIARTQKLREKVQELNPVKALDGEVVFRWEVSDNLEDLETSSSSLKFITVSMSIHPIQDFFMVFAPVDLEEAERILVYLNLNSKLYNLRSSLVTEGLQLEESLDFQYLFPVKISYLGPYSIITSEEFNDETLKIILQGEVPFEYPRVDDLQGAYATYLTAEAFYFNFSLRWESGKFYVGLAGYIQARNINEEFLRILTELYKTRLTFRSFPSLQEAVHLAEASKAKIFFHQGKYYVGLSENQGVEVQTSQKDQKVWKDQKILNLIENQGVLKLVTDPRYRQKTKKYLALLGYNTAAEPQAKPLAEPQAKPQTNQGEIKLGYRTYQDGGRIFTVYYYKSTYGALREIHEIDGPNHEVVFSELGRLLNQGYFSTLRFQNILRGYPGFIPSDYPIARNLPRQVESLIKRLKML